jgi:hypothetical protein
MRGRWCFRNGLRAALAPGGELVLESTPSGAYRAFFVEWCAGVEADGDGDVCGTGLGRRSLTALRHYVA